MARIPRQIRRTGSKYDIGMGRQGFFKCPHLGIYCNNGSARDIEKCAGGLACEKRYVNGLVERLWQGREAIQSKSTGVLA